MGVGRAPLVFTVLTCVVLLGFLDSFQSAYATTISLTDEASCIAIGGVWNAGTCTLASSITIASGDTLIVASGVTLELASGENLTILGIVINKGVITITGDGANLSGSLITMGSAHLTNFGTINVIGGAGNISGLLKVAGSSTLNNLNVIIITGNIGTSSGFLSLADTATINNSGTITVSGGSGQDSGRTDNWDSSRLINTGKITIIGSSGSNSGRINNMGTSSFTNNGIIIIISGTGNLSGRLINEEQGVFSNHGTITVGNMVRNGAQFFNSGSIIVALNFNNSHGSLTNHGNIDAANLIINDPGTIFNCGTITGTLIGDSITVIFCGIIHNSSSAYEDPTIGKSHRGIQVVQNGICINIICWTVTADYQQDFDLVELLTDSTHTISTTVFCQRGADTCNYVAFGVSPYGTNINDSVWKIILQKDHQDKWTMTVIDPDGYLGEVTSTTQIVNDGKHLSGSATIEFKKPTPGMILNVEVRDSGGGYRDFKFNDGVAIKDAYAYPSIETSYDPPIEVKPLCLNENPNKRYTCAFDLVREWTIKNAEKAIDEIT